MFLESIDIANEELFIQNQMNTLNQLKNYRSWLENKAVLNKEITHSLSFISEEYSNVSI